MCVLKICYDPIFNLLDKEGISERRVSARTGVARLTLSKLKSNTVKEMSNPESSYKTTRGQYSPLLYTFVLLSIYLDSPMDSMVYIEDPENPQKLITLEEARKALRTKLIL